MTKIRRKRLKGNDGRRRRQQRERLLTIAGTVACCLFVFFGAIPWLGGKKGTRDRPAAPLGQSQSNLEAFHPGDPKEGQKAPGSGLRKPGRGKRGQERDGLLPMRRALENPALDPWATERARDILSASTNLVDIEFGSHSSIEDESYRGVVAEFCPLDFSAQKEKPPELPMFRDVVRHSRCDEGGSRTVRVDLGEAVALAREFDGDNAGNLPAVLDLKGVVFHESRCGSTLAANSMMALDPEKHRVFSESSPPAAAMRACGEDYSNCSLEGAANVLQDVVYMMGRSGDPGEENLFFKFQSVTTRTMATFRTAFPTTPWIFLYREPVEVMMSQLDVPRTSKANCVKSRNSSPMVRDIIRRSEYRAEDFSNEEFCAVHLATLCESAVENLKDAEGLGVAVNYSPDLVHDFLDTVFPKHFHTPVDNAGRDRVMKISGTYSKNRGQHEEGDFKPDSEAKKKQASEEIKEAAGQFLEPSFEKLQQSEYNIHPSEANDDGDDDAEEI